MRRGKYQYHLRLVKDDEQRLREIADKHGDSLIDALRLSIRVCHSLMQSTSSDVYGALLVTNEVMPTGKGDQR